MPTYIITGSNRGLGLEFVRQLTTTAAGPNTVIACVRSLDGDLSKLKDLASKPSNGSTIDIRQCDTSSVKSIRAFAEALPSDIKPEVVINNAGINAVPDQDSLSLDAEDMHKHIDTNVIGPAEMTKVLLPRLGKGSLIFNMTSGLGSFGKGIFADAKTTYSISKAALNMLSAHQAASLKDRGIKVIVVDPGWVKTVSSMTFPARLTKTDLVTRTWAADGQSSNRMKASAACSRSLRRSEPTIAMSARPGSISTMGRRRPGEPRLGHPQS